MAKVLRQAPDPGDELVNRHDFWRAAYATMLAELPQEEIVEFFQTVPMRMAGKTYEDLDLVEHLWKEKASINMEWNYLAVNALEPFLVEKGHDAMLFMRKLLHRNNRATYMPGKIVLSWFYPVMDKIFDTYDPREMVFQLIAIYTEAYLPLHFHRRIKKEIDGEVMRSYLIYVSDTTFKVIRDLNFDHIAGPQIFHFPRIMDFPEFEGLGYLGDCRRPEDIIRQGKVVREGDVMTLDGRLLARRGSFKAFADSHGFDLRKLDPPDLEIFVAVEDYFCPVRKRVVIYKGCAYGAPGYISVITHRKIPNKERKLLDHLITDAALEGDLFDPEIGRRHDALCLRLKRVVEFTFFAGDESISINGVHLTKGVPAKILRNILAAYVRNGRRDFEYRDFKRDFDISSGQKNSNFEVRFYRLMKKLEEAAPSISIVKSGRGRFTLESKATVEFMEMP